MFDPRMSSYSAYDFYAESTKRLWLNDDGILKKNGASNKDATLNEDYKYYVPYSNYIKSFYNIEEYEIIKNKKYLRDLSKGNQKKVGIIATLIGNPEVVILDEPFANLDPTTVIRLKKIIKELAENPEITVLVSSHDLLHTVEVCNRIVALNKGEVVKDIQTSTETLKELETFFAV